MSDQPHYQPILAQPILVRHCTITKHFKTTHGHIGVAGEFRKPMYEHGDRVLVNGTFNVLDTQDFCGFHAPGKVTQVMVKLGLYRVMLDTGGNVLAHAHGMTIDEGE